MRQNEDIVAIEADLVGWGNGVRYGRGTNAARLLQAGHNCGAGSLVRAVLQRTQHFVGGLKIPTWARLRRAATSRPAAFDFSQVKNRRGAWTGSSENFLPHSPPSCCSLAPSAGAGRSSASSGRLFWFHRPKHQFTHIFPIASV